MHPAYAPGGKDAPHAAAEVALALELALDRVLHLAAVRLREGGRGPGAGCVRKLDVRRSCAWATRASG